MTDHRNYWRVLADEQTATAADGVKAGLALLPETTLDAPDTHKRRILEFESRIQITGPSSPVIMPVSNASAALIDPVLARNDIFASVPSDVLPQVAEAMQVSTLSPGDLLMSQGEENDSLYLLLQGTLLLLSTSGGPESASVSGFQKRLIPGDLVGEFGLIDGLPRVVTVVADEEAVVARLARERFLYFRQIYPEHTANVIAALSRRQETYQLEGSASASPFLQSMSADLREALLERMIIERVESGTTLLRAGEVTSRMYLVVSGRLQVSRSVDDSDENARMEAPFSGPKFAELGRGDTIGETTLMTGEPCPDTVVALRDSLVAALDRASFRQIAKDFPMEMLSAVSRQLNSRARQAASDRRYDRPPISIAILPLSHTADGSAVAARLERALETFGDVLSISPENPIVRNSSPASENRIVEWLNEQENHFRHVLYHIGNQPSRWARRALRQADRIFLLANAAERPADAAARFQQLLPVEAQEGESRTTNGRFHLVLLHDSGDSAATGTDAWLAAFPMVAEHHHLRLDHDKDFQRLARSVNDRLVGLALGGGFALGIAHVGVIRAMRDLDIPIDCVGGTSMGAIIGSSCALEIESQRMLDIVVAGRGAVRGDYTLPLLSVLTGAKFARMLGEHLGAYNIEDFWLPFFSVSASLRHARMVVHRRGDAVRSVLASCRAPVMFPPLSWNGDLLVDGGLVNNIPADVMRTMTPGGTVFAVDVSPSESIFPPAEESLATSGWRQIRRRWGSRAQARPEITLMEVLGRAIRLGGVSRAQRIHADTDCYLTPPLEQFKALDFSRGPAIEEKAYAYALHALGAWLQERGRPWESQQN